MKRGNRKDIILITLNIILIVVSVIGIRFYKNIPIRINEKNITKTKFIFGRDDGSIISTNVFLLKNGRIRGIIGNNEFYWTYKNSNIIFLDKNKNKTTIFNEKNSILEGKFLLDDRIVHTLTPVRSDNIFLYIIILMFFFFINLLVFKICQINIKNTALFLLKNRFLIALLFLILYVVYSILPIFNAGVIGSWDFVKHLYRAEFLAKYLDVNGFSLEQYNGFQVFLFYFPGFSLLIAVLHLLTLKLIPVIVIYKFLILFTYVALPAGIYFLIKIFNFKKTSRLIAALFVFTFNTAYGFGFSSTFKIGLDVQFFSVSLITFAIGVYYKYVLLMKERKIVYTLLISLFFAFIILVHLQTGIYLGILLILLNILFFLKIENKINYTIHNGIVIITTLLLISFWLIPMYINYDLYGMSTAFGRPTIDILIKDFIAGNFLSTNNYISYFVILGLVFLVLRKKELNIFISLSILITLVLSFKFFTPNNKTLLSLMGILENRTFSPLCLWFSIVAGNFIGEFYLIIKRIIFLIYRYFIKFFKNPALIKIMNYSTRFALISLQIVFIIFSFNIVRQYFKKSSHLIRTESDIKNAKFFKLMDDSIQFIKKNVNDKGKLAMQITDFTPMHQEINVYYQLRTGLPIFGGGHSESSKVACLYFRYFSNDAIKNASALELYDILKKFNIKYFIVKNESYSNKFDIDSNYIRLYSNELLKLYEIKGVNQYYISNNNNLSVLNSKFETEISRPKLYWEIDNYVPDNKIDFTLSYSPLLRVKLNDEYVKTNSGKDYNVYINVIKVGYNKIEICYKLNWIYILFNTISTLTLIFIIIFFLLQILKKKEYYPFSNKVITTVSKNYGKPNK